jgi:hypothetical protein
VIASTPIAEIAVWEYLPKIGEMRELPVPGFLLLGHLAGRLSSDGDMGDSLRSQW